MAIDLARLLAQARRPKRASVLFAALGLFVIASLVWALAGKVELGEYSGSASGDFAVDRWPELEFTASQHGLHRIELRLRAVDRIGRGVAVRLRDGANPSSDLVAWTIDPLTGDAVRFLEMPPIGDSANRQFLLIVEPLPGPGGSPLVATNASGPPLHAQGTTRTVGLELRRYYAVSPVTWVRVTLSRAGGPGLILLLATAAAGYLAFLLTVLALTSRGAGNASTMVASVPILAVAFFAGQVASSRTIWGQAAGALPDENGRVIADFGRRIGAPDTVISGADGIQSGGRAVGVDWPVVAGVRRPAVLAHPPVSFAMTTVVSEKAVLRYSAALRPEVWSPDKGDGVGFQVLARVNGHETVLMDDWIDPKNIPGDRRWHDRSVWVGRWAGNEVTFVFSTRSGSNDDYDFALWGQPVVVQ